METKVRIRKIPYCYEVSEEYANKKGGKSYRIIGYYTTIKSLRKGLSEYLVHEQFDKIDKEYRLEEIEEMIERVCGEME